MPKNRDMGPTVMSTEVPAAEGGSATIATVERAADVLLYFAESSQPDLGVTEVADGLGLSKAAVHRMLASLRSRGLIQLDEDTRRYSLGVAAMRLGLAYLERIDVRRMAKPYLVGLSKATNETATLSVRIGRNRVYVDQVIPDREVIMSVTLGEPFPLHAGASSKAFLAFLTDAEIEDYLSHSPLESLTADTIVDVRALRKELGVVKAQGWACSFAERKGGAASVAVPIFGHDASPQAVMSVCGPLERFSAELEDCRRALMSASEGLSRELGWTPA